MQLATTPPAATMLPARTQCEQTRNRAVRIGGLLAAVLACALAGLSSRQGASMVPAMWPAAGVAAGLYLTSPKRLRPGVLAGVLVVLVVAHLLQGHPPLSAVGFSASSVLAVWVVRRRLVAGMEGKRVALLGPGDVSRMIGSIATGCLVAGAGYALTDLVVGRGDPWLAGIAAAGAHAASLMVLLPLFLETLDHEPLAGARERATQGVITVGTTIFLFALSDVPPLVFVVMPMFAWHAFRGSLREATLLLTLVGVIGTGFTMAGVGPIHSLGTRYDLAPEMVSGVLQLFLLDCGLILLPLSVMVTQHRVAAARADAERETLQRLVASATGTAIIATGPDGRIEVFNPGAEQMLGFLAEEVLGELPDVFITEEELRAEASALRALPNFADICRASVAVGDSNRLWRLRRKDGEERVMRMTLTAVPDERGDLTGYLATAEDVTEREAAQQALLETLQHQERAVQRLEELERVKGDFVSTISHELRTPITSIIGYTEMLEDGMVGDLSEGQLDVVGRVDRNGRRLLLLVEDLLTLSQIESSRLKMQPVSTDLRAVVAQACEAVAGATSQRRLQVKRGMPEHPVVHEGDPGQLQRMVTALLTNAVKFTPDDGSVGVSLKVVGDDTEIIVQDTGMGIPEAEQDRLFTRFFRSTTAYEQAVQGAGMGLTIVQAIVALHGGRIGVTSVENQGTTVTVTLPRVALARPVVESIISHTAV